MKKFTVKPRTFLTNEIIVGKQNLKPPIEKILIGRLAEIGGIVNVNLEASAEQVVAIFGKRGSGKSYSMGSIIEGYCIKEPSEPLSTVSKNKAVLLFDTLGIYQWMDVTLDENSNSELIKKQSAFHKKWSIKAEPLDVILFEPKIKNSIIPKKDRKVFTLNVPDLSASDWGSLFGLDIYTDRMGQLLNDTYLKVTLEGWATKEKFFKPKTNYSILDFIDCIKHDKELNEIYHSETLRALLQQFINFSRNPIFQSEGTRLVELLQPGHLSVILLHKIPDELRLVIVSSLIRKIIETRVEVSEKEKEALIKGIDKPIDRNLDIPPSWIVIDEAQNLIPSERKSPAGELLVKLVREGRNFGISFMFTTQQPSAIDPRILAQVDTMLVHRLTVQQDIDYIKKNLKSALPEEVRYSGRNLSFEDSIRLLDVGQCFVSNTELDRGFYMDVRPRISVHGGF